MTTPGFFVRAAWACLVLLVLLPGCTEKAGSGKTLVAATIPPVAGFVEEVGGDRVEVMVMVPPGATPHTYEPRPSQLKRLAGASLYAKVGSGVEFELAWLPRLLELNPNLTVVDLSEGLDTEDIEDSHEEDGHDDHDGHVHSEGDPHVWLSPVNAAIMVENIYRGLVRVDPAGEELYRENADRFKASLMELDREIRYALDESGVKSFFVYHPAWSHFAREYGLQEVAMEREGKAPSARDLAELVETARAEGVKVVFASPEFSTRSVETLAHEIGAEVVLISPLAKDYRENMRALVKTLARAGKELSKEDAP